MQNTAMRLLRAASLATLLLAAPAVATFAQDAAAPATEQSTVVATVGPHTITEADMAFAAEDMAQDLAQLPPPERRAFLVRILIDMKVMAEAARAEGMDKTETFAQRLAYLEDRALRRAYFNDAIVSAVTEDAARAEYDKFAAEYVPQDEVHARHILVEDEAKANELKAELDKGADFAKLAIENSIDPGAANGGDLGFFGKGMMVAPFEAAAFALENVGDVSAPVQSQFGWHIIKLEEKRKSAPPSFEQVAGQIQQQLMMQTFNEKVNALMDGLDVTINDADLKAKFDEQEAAEAQAAGEAETASE